MTLHKFFSFGCIRIIAGNRLVTAFCNRRCNMPGPSDAARSYSTLPDSLLPPNICFGQTNLSTPQNTNTVFHPRNHCMRRWWWRCKKVVLWDCGFTVLWFYGVVVSWDYGVVDFWFCGVVGLWYCGVTVLRFYGILVFPLMSGF